MKFLKCLQLSVWCSCKINGQIGDCRPNTVKRAKKKTGNWHIICELHWRAFEIKGEHTESFSQSFPYVSSEAAKADC